MFIHDNALGVATISDLSGLVLIRRVEGERHVRTELLEPGFALRARAVRINQTADSRKVAQLKVGHSGADLGDTADDLMSRHNRVYSRHELAPFVAYRMEIRVANAAEQNFDLHVAL